jgi:hypothetical protein
VLRATIDRLFKSFDFRLPFFRRKFGKMPSDDVRHLEEDCGLLLLVCRHSFFPLLPSWPFLDRTTAVVVFQWDSMKLAGLLNRWRQTCNAVPVVAT